MTRRVRERQFLTNSTSRVVLSRWLFNVRAVDEGGTQRQTQSLSLSHTHSLSLSHMQSAHEPTLFLDTRLGRDAVRHELSHFDWRHDHPQRVRVFGYTYIFICVNIWDVAQYFTNWHASTGVMTTLNVYVFFDAGTYLYMYIYGTWLGTSQTVALPLVLWGGFC